MTILCAFAGNFHQLFLCRAGVGLAEAVIGPAAFSLIRDAVAERHRGLAFSLYAMSPAIGGTVALAAGGLLLQAAHGGLFEGVAALAGRAPWRIVLMLIGLAGLPLSLLLLMFPEPARGGAVGRSAAAALPQAVAHLRAQAGMYAALVGFVTFGAMMAFGQSAWLPAMLSRNWAIPPGRLGPILGGLTLGCGLAGLSVSGYVINRVLREGGNILVFGAIAVLGTGFGLSGAALAPSFGLALVFGAIGLFFVGVSYPVGATFLARVTPSPLMGKIAAAYLMAQTLLGQACGPVLIALASQHVFHGRGGLSDAFALSMGVFGLASFICAWTLLKSGPARALAARPA